MGRPSEVLAAAPKKQRKGRKPQQAQEEGSAAPGMVDVLSESEPAPEAEADMPKRKNMRKDLFEEAGPTMKDLVSDMKTEAGDGEGEM